jgi:prepilin peptidase CpaA
VLLSDISEIFSLVLSAALPVAMLYAAVSDVARYEVPNWVSVVIVAAFLAFGATEALGWSVLLWHLAAGFAVLAIGLVLFGLGWMGGADVKLIAAGAVWTGWLLLAQFVLLVALFGGALAALLLVARRIGLPARWRRHGWLERLFDRRQKLPYCVAIAAAALLIYPRLPVLAAAGGP